MKEQESYRVKELVLLKESYEGGLSHRESCLVHGVSYNTSRYALYWCRRMHPRAEAFVPADDIARYPRIAIFAGELRPPRLPRVNVPHVGIRSLFGSYGREGVGADGPAIRKGIYYGKDREVDEEP